MVKCSNTTGRIVKLHLGDLRQVFYKNNNYQNWFLDFNTFFPLKNLQFLSLSSNSFEVKITGCEQLVSLKNLQFLDLELNYVNSSIFQCIAAFPSLKYLSLAGNGLEGPFPYKELNHLQQLQQLDLSYSSLSGSLQGICNLKNLEKLDLSVNSFTGSIPLCLNKLTSLKVFDISTNNFSGIIPELVISNLVHLECLSLSHNYFEGSFLLGSFANNSELQVLSLSRVGLDFEGLPFPPLFQLRLLEMIDCNLSNISMIDHHQLLHILYNQKELRVLDISSSGFSGNIPLWLLENNTSLDVLSLRNNSFMGQLMVGDTMKWNLSEFGISNNKVEGQIPQNFGLLFPTLIELNLSRNSFEGSIPESFGNLTSAVSIDLSNNNFSGEVPDQIGIGCVSLSLFLLSNNRWEGNFPSSSMNLTHLQVLYLRNNHFSGHISQSLSHSYFLQFLDTSNNEFQGKIPCWIANLTSLRILDLSHNQLEGSIPDDICQLTLLEFLDLSENWLNGSIPACSSLSKLRFIHLHKNQITGRIPNTLFQNWDLMTLDLRHNHLSGGIPSDIRTSSELRNLLLGGNNLKGQIPLYICHLRKLAILDLSQNHFSGRIPHCLNNISFGKGYSSEDSYLYLLGEIYYAYGGLIGYQFKRSLDINEPNVVDFPEISGVQEEVEFTTKSRINTYAGNILSYMSGLDLSCNELTGDIPQEIGHLIDIRALNLSHNHLQGSIPSRLSKLNLIESLDLSYNNLTGQIPLELTNLNSLSIFNVSYNNLSGKTPDKNQFADFDESNYRGNPNLCGPNIDRHCEITAGHDPGYDDHDDIGGGDADSAIDMVAFLWSFFVSYTIALLTLALTLYINPQFCKVWFDFIDMWILSRIYDRYKSCSKYKF